jgi:dephospho-CoA kinase
MPSQPPSRQTERLILGISGRIGSGKTTAAEYLVRVHGFKYLRYSQVLAEWRGVDPGDKIRLQEVGWEVMNGGLQKDLNLQLLARIDDDSSYTIDGLRHLTDYESLKSKFPISFHLIFIDCAAEIRWQRLRPRFGTFEDFEKADAQPVEQQLASLENTAEFRLSERGPESNLVSDLESIIDTIKKGVH